jgi:hypothetical protein
MMPGTRGYVIIMNVPAAGWKNLMLRWRRKVKGLIIIGIL